MIPLPKWMKDFFINSVCPFCKKSCKRKGVYGLGVREEEHNKKGHTKIFCYEYKCPYCNNRSVFTGFPTSFEDFIADMIDIADIPIMMDDPEVESPNTTSKTGGMSDQEIENAKKMISDSHFFDDLLGKLGIKDQYPDINKESGPPQ